MTGLWRLYRSRCEQALSIAADETGHVNTHAAAVHLEDEGAPDQSGAVASIVAAEAALFVGDVVDAGTTAGSVPAVARLDGFDAAAISVAGAAAGVGAADAAGVVAAGIVEAVGGVIAAGDGSAVVGVAATGAGAAPAGPGAAGGAAAATGVARAGARPRGRRTSRGRCISRGQLVSVPLLREGQATGILN